MVAGPVRMAFVNFYSRNGTRAQHPSLAPLEKKLDGIFNILTQQNHQMTALQEQKEQTLQHMGNLDGRLCSLVGKVDELEKYYSSSAGSSSESKKTKSCLPPELCVSSFSFGVKS